MVVKFTPEGRIAMVLHHKKEASDKAEPLGACDATRRRRSSAAFPAANRCAAPGRYPAGNIYISDGYINSRVAIDRDGEWVKTFGEPGAGPGQLNTPHSIAADVAGNLYVADRGNKRVQVFDPDGKVLREIRVGGTSACRCEARLAVTTAPNLPQRQAGQVCITPVQRKCLYVSNALPGLYTK